MLAQFACLTVIRELMFVKALIEVALHSGGLPARLSCTRSIAIVFACLLAMSLDIGWLF